MLQKLVIQYNKKKVRQIFNSSYRKEEVFNWMWNNIFHFGIRKKIQLYWKMKYFFLAQAIILNTLIPIWCAFTRKYMIILSSIPLGKLLWQMMLQGVLQFLQWVIFTYYPSQNLILKYYHLDFTLIENFWKTTFLYVWKVVFLLKTISNGFKTYNPKDNSIL